MRILAVWRKVERTAFHCSPLLGFSRDALRSTGYGSASMVLGEKRDVSLNSRHRPATLLQFGTLLRKSLGQKRPDGGEALLRSELFSREQMKQHGKSLAASHAVARG